MLDADSTILLFQTIPGIPSTLVSGQNAKPIVDVSNNIWGVCGFLFSLFVVIGIWMSQYKMIAEKTGGPSQYLNRAITVGVTLAGYKILFALILWTTAYAAYKIYPNATADAWIPAGGSLTKYITPSSATPTPTPRTPGATPTPPVRQIGANTSVMEVIMWGISNAYGMSFQALPAMLIIMLCNIFFVLAIFLISAFWLVFALILYALGPFMITAGLIPGYGDKIWGHWIGATIQCGLWQVWMAFCGMLITSPLLTQLSNLNPKTRLETTSGGGDLSGALMDVQQAAYSVTFLILYLATPLVVNYIFPIGTSGSMGGFMLGGATRMVGKGIRLAGAIKSGGMSEAAKQAASAGIKQTTSRPEGAVASAGSKAASGGGAKSAQAGNQTTSGGQSMSNNGGETGSYDGSTRNNQYRVAKEENAGVSAAQKNSSVTQNYSSGSQNTGGSTATTSSTGITSSAESPRQVYKESTTRPSDIKFGELPKSGNMNQTDSAKSNNSSQRNGGAEN